MQGYVKIHDESVDGLFDSTYYLTDLSLSATTGELTIYRDDGTKYTGGNTAGLGSSIEDLFIVYLYAE